MFALNITSVTSFVKSNWKSGVLVSLLLILSMTTFETPFIWFAVGYFMKKYPKMFKPQASTWEIEQEAYTNKQCSYQRQLEEYYTNVNVDIDSWQFKQCPEDIKVQISSLIEFLQMSGVSTFISPEEVTNVYQSGGSDRIKVKRIVVSMYLHPTFRPYELGSREHYEELLFTLYHEAGHAINELEGKDVADESLAWDTGLELYRLVNNSEPFQAWWGVRQHCLASYGIVV